MNPGDLIAFETRGLFAALIRFGQRITHVKNWRYTHIAIVAEVQPNGDAKLIQSVRRVNAVWLNAPRSDGGYIDIPRVVLPFPGGDDKRSQIVAFAQSALGRKYGVLSVVSRAINCLPPKWISFEHGGDCDCSTLAARAWEHGGVILPQFDPYVVMPGNLVDWYLRGDA